MRTYTTRLQLGILALVLFFGLAALAACGGSTAGGQTAPTAQPSGDPANGEQVFNNSDCKGCHTTTDQKLVGPGLKGVMDGKGAYGDKLPNGKPITDQNTAEWIKVGGVGKIGQMPGHSDLTPEQLTDLVAYLKTLK
jgi:cytochrome c